jgi:nitrate reductase assembly molybdenum cofactor insertion protein NarJ
MTIHTHMGESAQKECIRQCLEQASFWRAISLLFRSPDATILADLRQLVPCLDETLRGDVTRFIHDLSESGMEELHFRLLGAAATCPICESDYTPSCLGAKGGPIGDIAAFYKAFAFDPAAELRESPDHFCIETSFLAWLHMKEAYALSAGNHDAADTCRAARDTFMIEHFGPFLDSLAARLAEVAGDSVYAHMAVAARLALPYPAASEAVNGPVAPQL